MVLVIALHWQDKKKANSESFHLETITAASPPIEKLYCVSFCFFYFVLGQKINVHFHYTTLQHWFQLSSVLFWCVSLFPRSYPSNQLWSISDFLSSPINSGWASSPEESWANEDTQIQTKPTVGHLLVLSWVVSSFFSVTSVCRHLNVFFFFHIPDTLRCSAFYLPALISWAAKRLYTKTLQSQNDSF